MKKFKSILFLIIVITFLTSACGQKSAENIPNTNENIRIVTSFYPIYLHVINITKNVPGVEVVNMTKPQTGCLHDYQLTPNDLKTLENADIFVINGGGMESFMDKVVSQLSNLNVVNASEGISLLKEEQNHEDYEIHEHEEGEHHDNDHDHDHEYNPHVWVSITGAIAQVENITNELANIDKGNENIYRENSQSYIYKLQSLSEEMHNVLDNVTYNDIITFHEAFPYFAHEFGLNIVGTIIQEEDTEPTAKQIEQIIKTIKDLDVKAVFVEPQYSSKVADVVAKETNVKIYTLDPIVTGEANPDQEDAYIIKMRENLKILEEALK